MVNLWSAYRIFSEESAERKQWYFKTDSCTVTVKASHHLIPIYKACILQAEKKSWFWLRIGLILSINNRKAQDVPYRSTVYL